MSDLSYTQRNGSRLWTPDVAYYEGANPTQERMLLPYSWWVTDAWSDTSKMEHDTLVGSSRYLYNNNAFYRRIINITTSKTVGSSGLRIIPASGDSEFDKLAEERWNEWCENEPDVSSLLSFSRLQSICSDERKRDGDIFCVLHIVDGEPKIQFVESHRVFTANSKTNNSTVNGVEVNEYGKPTAYWVSSKFDGDKATRFSAAQVIHFYDPTRVGEYRGEPLCAPVLNDFIDLIMVQAFAVSEAKYRGSRIGLLETPGGEKIDFSGIRNSTLGTGNVTIQQRLKTLTDEDKAAIKQSVGAHVAFVPQGTKFTDVHSDSPSNAQFNLFEYLLNKICLGIGPSRGLVSPAATQGTVARIDVELNNDYFVSQWEIEAEGFLRVYKHVIRSIGKACKPEARWWSAIVQPPRAITADLGYEMDIITEGIRYGLFTFEEILARRGVNPKEHIRRIVEERKALVEAAKESGCTVQELMSRGLAEMSGNMPKQEETTGATETNQNKKSDEKNTD